MTKSILTFLYDRSFRILILITSLITIGLVTVTHDINFWPTDSELFYIPAARQLFQLASFSEIHKIVPRASFWLKEHHIRTVVVLNGQINNEFVAGVLNHPGDPNPIRIDSIPSLRKIPDGYVLIPPLTRKVIWQNCAADNDTTNPLLLKAIRLGKLASLAEKQWPTMANSHFWNQEEEVCTYRDIIRHDITDDDRRLGFAYLIQGKQLAHMIEQQDTLEVLK